MHLPIEVNSFVFKLQIWNYNMWIGLGIGYKKKLLFEVHTFTHIYMSKLSTTSMNKTPLEERRYIYILVQPLSLLSIDE